jgi:hypothetical protein
MERLTRLEWVKTTSGQMVGLCHISAAVFAWCERTSQTGWSLNRPLQARQASPLATGANSEKVGCGALNTSFNRSYSR